MVFDDDWDISRRRTAVALQKRAGMFPKPHTRG